MFDLDKFYASKVIHSIHLNIDVMHLHDLMSPLLIEGLVIEASNDYTVCYILNCAIYYKIANQQGWEAPLTTNCGDLLHRVKKFGLYITSYFSCMCICMVQWSREQVGLMVVVR